MTDRVTSYASEYLGDGHVVEMETMMAAEDFAWYKRIIIRISKATID